MMEQHRIASIFPMLHDDDLQKLANDIAANGLREPITTFENKILDGRNRFDACKLAGVKPAFCEFRGTAIEAIQHVWSLNRHRRHLNSSQAAYADAKRAAMVDEYAAAIQKAKDAARDRQKEAAKKGGQKSGETRRGETKVPQTIAEPSHNQKPRAENNEVRTQRAKAAGTNRQYINEADRLHKERPDLGEKIERGELTLPQARREVAREQRRRELETKAKANGKRKSDWKIINGDCVAELKKIEAGTVRLAFADPPYNIGIDYGEGEEADKLPESQYLDWCYEWLMLTAETLTADGSFWVMINDQWAGDFAVMLRDLGLHRRAWIKWYETFGVNQGNNFNRCSRHIFYTTKSQKGFVFNPESVSRPSDRQTKYKDKRADPGGKIWDDVWQIPRLTGTAKERIPDFPTQIPLEITRAIVGCASDPGDLVLDPFSGSASTGAACVESGRRYVGIERSKDFARLSKLRLEGIS